MFQREYLEFARELLDCVNLKITEVPPPYDAAVFFDHGLRNLLENETHSFRNSAEEYGNIEVGYLYSLHSRLSYVTVFYRLPPEEGGSILIFGPFLQEVASDAFIRKVMRENGLSENLWEMLRLYYSELPVLPESTALKAARSVLARCTAAAPKKDIVRFVFSGKPDESLSALPTPAHQFSMELSEKTDTHRQHLLHAVRSGDVRQAITWLERYIQSSGLFKSDNLSQLRQELWMFNAICECVLRSGSVHALYRQSLSRELTKEIELCKSASRLRVMPLHIVERYCGLVGNHGFAAYSSLVQKAVDYIDMNMEETITLSMLAQRLNRNASYLSACFKKETGLTVTQYVHARKIEQAAWLLSSSDVSVRQAALQVGFCDAGYFSRLFKAQFGISPQKYSKRNGS